MPNSRNDPADLVHADGELQQEVARRKEAEGRLRLFVEHAPAAIALFDRDMRYLAASRRWLADYRLEGDVTGKSHYEVFPEVPERWREIHRRGLAGEVLRAEEDAFERPDGAVQWLRWEVRPWHAAGGEVGGIIIFAEEVSQEKRAEQERQDALRLKQVITDNATTAIVMQDAAGRCTFMNPAAEQMTGFTFAELKGKNVHDTIHHSRPDGRPFPRSECEIGKAVMAMRPIRRHEDVFVRKDGSFFPVMCNASPVRQGGVLTEVVLEFRDITEEKRAEQALRESEERFRTVFESMDEGYCVIEVIFDERDRPVDYRFLEINPAFEKQTGIKDAKGRLMREIAPDHERHWFEIYGRIALTGETLRFENPAAALGRWYDVCAFRVGPPELRHVGIVFNDITERRQVAEALRESERRYRSLAEALPQLVWTDLPDGTCDYLSSQWETYTGIPVAELLGFTWLDRVIHPDDRERTLQCWLTAVADKGVYDLEYRIRRHDGEYRWFKTRGVPIRGPDGRIVKWFGTCTDVEDSKRAEQALRESERRLRFVMDSMPQKIFTTRPNGEVDYFNPIWMEFTGLSFEQIRDWGWTQFVHPDDLAENVRAWKQSVETGSPFQFEHRFRRHDGEYRWHISRAVPLRDEAGRVVLWVGSNTDIHEVKQSQEALREADRRKDEFLAMLGHELRNPLAAVRNGLHVLLLADGNEAAAAQAKAMMNKQVGNLTRMVDDLLDVSRITRGKIQLRKEPVVLGAVVNHAVESVRPLVEAQRHTLTVRAGGPPVRLEADPTRLEQVFVNLLTNAAKYTRPGGSITVTAGRERDEAVVRVRDSGVGIRPDLLPKMFDLFVQSERSLDRSQGGLGIGLTLVKKLVEMHGGSVEAHSDGVDRGSEFVVRLPALPPGQEGAERAPEPAVAAGAKSRVLVVEDTADVAESLRMLLELWGYDVRVVDDGPSALAAYRTYQPDVVLLDIGLPGMNGYDVARQLRRQQGGRRPFIMAVTGYGQEEDKRRSREAGFDCHMTKPVEPGQLQTVLATVKSA